MTAVSSTLGGDAERLASLIREQAREESTQALANGRERAERIRAAGEAEAEDLRTAAEREGEARGRRRAAECLAAARTQGRMAFLEARELLLETALTQASAQLAGLATMPDAAERVAGLIREGLQRFPPGPVRVRMGEGEAALLTPKIVATLEAGRWAVRIEPAASAGVVLESEDGRLRFDNSLDARMRRRRDHLRRLAASILFPNGEKG